MMYRLIEADQDAYERGVKMVQHAIDVGRAGTDVDRYTAVGILHGLLETMGAFERGPVDVDCAPAD